MREELVPVFNMIETIIRDLGIDPTTTRGEKPGQWSLVKGSAKVWIDVWHIERENRAYFQVMSPVMRLPAQEMRLPFFQELLEINDKLFGVAFTMYNGWIWLKHIRETDGLDKSEAEAMIHRVGNYGDQYDDHLKQKYPEAAQQAGAPGAPGAPGKG